jgi:hypothetical protein
MVAMVCCGANALADSVSVYYSGPGGASLAGIYVYPYNLDLTNQPAGTPANPYAICDDFVDDIYPGDSWTANVYTISDLANLSDGDLQQTRFGSNPSLGSATALQDYEAAAELAQEMTACSPSTNCAGDYNFAIWEIFDPPTDGQSCADPSAINTGAFAPTPYGSLGSADLAAAQTAYCKALGGTYTADEFPNWEVLTPVAGSVVTTHSGDEPQEFLIDPNFVQGGPLFATTEAPTVTMLGFGGLGLLGLIFVFRRGKDWLMD